MLPRECLFFCPLCQLKSQRILHIRFSLQSYLDPVHGLSPSLPSPRSCTELTFPMPSLSPLYSPSSPPLSLPPPSRNSNSSFREVLEKLESDPICQRLSLKSFLILPFQRITRLKLLLQVRQILLWSNFLDSKT